MADAQIRAVITAKDEASAVLQGFSAKTVALGNLISDSIEKAASTLIDFGINSVKAFTESQDLIAQTNAVLKSTGGIAGVTADQVTELAIAWQKQSKFSDEAVRGAENILLTFTSIGKDKFPDATAAVLDMSTALHEDLQSASIQVGKALQDPVLGITALRRVGVNFNDAQKEVVKHLVETGHSAEAQALILKELNTEFGGSAKAAGETFSGSLAKLKNKFNDVQESIGQTLVKGLTPLADKLANFVSTERFQTWLKNLTDWLNINLPKAMDYVINTLLPLVKKGFDEIWPVVKTLLDKLADLIKFLEDHTNVFWGLVTVLGAIKLAMMLSGALEAFQGVMAGATASFSGLSALVSTPLVMPAIAVGAALLAIDMVYNKFMETQKVIDDTQNHVKSSIDSIANAYDKTIALTKAPNSPEVIARAKATLHAEGVKGYASGTNFAPGGLALVGERGPELVNLPRGSQVIPHSGAGRTGGVNISVNVGVFAGTQMELRKLATTLQGAYQDAQSMGTA